MPKKKMNFRECICHFPHFITQAFKSSGAEEALGSKYTPFLLTVVKLYAFGLHVFISCGGELGVKVRG